VREFIDFFVNQPEWLLVLLCVVLVCLPPKYDPALQLKLWNERVSKQMRNKQDGTN
jgi:hypothetical protein